MIGERFAFATLTHTQRREHMRNEDWNAQIELYAVESQSHPLYRWIFLDIPMKRFADFCTDRFELQHLELIFSRLHLPFVSFSIFVYVCLSGLIRS